MKKKLLKNTFFICWILTICIAIILCILLFIVKFDANNELNDLKAKIKDNESMIATKNGNILELNSKISELSQTDKQAEIENSIKALESKVNTLTSQKTQLESEIETLKADVITLKGEPKTYPAGQLTAGIDVPIGKYKIYGGSSNFIVRSSSGGLRVNTILGGNYGVDEYIYTFRYGDKIDAHSSFKLVEVN